MGPILEHGVGTVEDLPIPPEFAIAGAVAALAVSFTVLAVAWRTPRYDGPVGERRGRSLPGLTRLVDSGGFRLAASAVGLLLTGWLVLAAALGKDQLDNPFFRMFFVHLWVGLVPASLLLGPVLRALSPWRTLNALLSRLSATDPDRGLRELPARWGYWPAALGLLAFVWLELVYPHPADLAPSRLWFAVYAGAMLMGGAVFGNGFYARCDPFEVYSSLMARLSPWGRRDGVVVLRSPLANVATTPTVPGLVAVVAVLFGSTAFDSFKDASFWLRTTQASSAPYLLDNLALLTFCVGVGVVLTVATLLTRVRPEVERRTLPDRFAHSVLPIIAGYIVAHYLSFFVEDGMLGVIQMSDPLSTDANLLGTANWQVSYWLSNHPTVLAVTKVVAVVVGHVLGVVAAHDRAISLLPKRDQVVGQLSMLVAMVGFTVGGLYLLFAS